MLQKRTNNYLLGKIQEMQSKGIYSFSLAKIRVSFPGSSEQALALALNRLVKKRTIVSVHKGFYVIVPTEYATQGILPIPLFIDALMKHLKRKYYVGLLNAAALHGAAHQQPQDYFVVTGLPALRSKSIKGLKIQYVAKKLFPSGGLEQRKTDTGVFKVSSPELTALDLVQFESRVGGLNRVIQVLGELLETLDSSRMTGFLADNEVPQAYIQRLGFLLRNKLGERPMSEVLLDRLDRLKRSLQNTPLKSKGKRSGFPIDPVWKVIENIPIDISR